MVVASKDMKSYFERIQKEVLKQYDIAQKARLMGYDPEDNISIPLAKNMAERVEGLISSVAPQIIGSGITERIVELEKEYGTLSWKVALVIAKEVAMQKFCTFSDRREAIEVGIRTGFAYHTVGVVAAPLEGFVELKIKKRRDGKEYFSLLFSGPIRGAGGTASSVSLVIADYVRKSLGYSPYDPDEQESKRLVTELYDYHDRVTNLQYKPSEEEIEFIARNLPVEVNGDPTENIEVSNYKDLERIETNRIRGGVCLVISMVALKAPKLWKEISRWGNDFGLDDWTFIGDFLEVQKKAKAGNTVKKQSKQKQRVSPDNTFIADLVSGRPVLTHPMSYGGFRLRYGRSRVSGYSSVSIHPATMALLNDYIAVGTQIKTERPGKAASVTSCDTIEGPIVLLECGTVMQVTELSKALEIGKDVKEILFLGDILCSYGDFFDRAHMLIPAGYVNERYSLELKNIVKNERSNDALVKEGIDPTIVTEISNNPFSRIPSVREAIMISKALNMPMHPYYTPHYKAINNDELVLFFRSLHETPKTIMPSDKIVVNHKYKRLYERMGIPHILSGDNIIISEEYSIVFKESFPKLFVQDNDCAMPKEYSVVGDDDIIVVINNVSKILFRDRSGTFIGARMGRPEKAKMRKLTGSPHGLFPVGEEGGRMRSFQAAIDVGKVNSGFSEYYCAKCESLTIYRLCEKCGAKTVLKDTVHSRRDIDVRHYIKKALESVSLREFPDLIKGVRGTANATRIPEHMSKAILRAVHDVYVNKDGTIRYDMTELPITHFKPKEIGTSIKKLKSMGYDKDIFGTEIVSDNQVIELRPQDIILGAALNSPDDPADQVLFKIGCFVDDLLVRLYNQKPHYNYATKEDTVGAIVIGLAPHTSAGIVGRVIGYSMTQSMLCHPLYHAAMRRDTDGDESCVMLLMDGLLNFSRSFLPDRRGSRTMDAPLVLTSVLDPAEVDDMVHKLDIVWEYPLELYEKADAYGMPWEVDITLLSKYLGTERQYEGMGYTHDTNDINAGVTCSAYKLLPSMQEKLMGQMDIASKVRAVDKNNVAQLVIEKHLIRDIKGNLRKFSMQSFRCVSCNDKFRRPPLAGKCSRCNGKIIFTISEGSIVKYLDPAKSLAEAYNLSPYLKETIELLDRRIIEVFGKDKEKQLGLGAWF
ncbi:MAG: DNA polymerase II large subunit [Candidatus Woesearchaeota archaeon]